jgi:hypothetical protein
MLTFTLIGFEIFTIVNYGVNFLGWITLAALVIGLIMLSTFTWRDDPVEFGETEIINRNPMPSPRATSLGAESRSTSQILDQCLSHRAQLQFYYETLCQRVGVDHQSLSPMADLISSAVFDGHNVPQCIYEVDIATQETQERTVKQHA